MLKILHFADAHIDMTNYGRHDPVTGLPMRVLDFLKSLDVIVDTAIQERVDLVLFAGDAYKDRSPAPTFQREWGRRIMRLSRAGIPALLLVGNHDLSPALNRAHALDSFETLEVPNVCVLDSPQMLGPDRLWNLPLQVIALPWIARSGLMAYLGLSGDMSQVHEAMVERISEVLDRFLVNADPGLPVLLAAHCTIQGAQFGGERAVMLGTDLVLPASLVKDPRLSYVALGHIHKHQDLNPDSQPPVVYPGSIERVDFGEVKDDKYFVIAHIEPGAPTRVEWRRLDGIRPFIDRRILLDSQEGVMECLLGEIPSPEALEGAIMRLVVEYPRDWETLIDEAALRAAAAGAFEFHLVKRPQVQTRIRLPEDQTIGSLTSIELLEKYWSATHLPADESAPLRGLAESIIQDTQSRQ